MLKFEPLIGSSWDSIHVELSRKRFQRRGRFFTPNFLKHTDVTVHWWVTEKHCNTLSSCPSRGPTLSDYKSPLRYSVTRISTLDTRPCSIPFSFCEVLMWEPLQCSITMGKPTDRGTEVGGWPFVIPFYIDLRPLAASKPAKRAAQMLYAARAKALRRPAAR